jgi:hypothetical protein
VLLALSLVGRLGTHAFLSAPLRTSLGLYLCDAPHFPITLPILAVPTQQGGSSFQRNVAPPVEILGVPKTLSSKYGGGAHH